eukprot:2997658-Pleurochrysis_carterae.AAC.1
MTRTRTRPPATQLHNVAARAEVVSNTNSTLPKRAPSPVPSALQTNPSPTVARPSIAPSSNASAPVSSSASATVGL